MKKLICTLVLFLFSALSAYDEPPVNLGLTTFLDGGLPNGPGWYYENYLLNYNTHRFNDEKGDRLPFPKTSLNFVVDINQLIYVMPQDFWGMKLGFDLLVPIYLHSRADDGLHRTFLRSSSGVGDFFIGPMLQFDPIMSGEGKDARPIFVHRLEFDFIVPAGRYSRSTAITPGSHFWSFNPYWAATIFPTAKWEISWRLHYLWNAKNTRPKLAFGPDVHSTQAGQAFHANFASSIEVIEKLRFGVNAYVFTQFTDTKVDGHNVPGRREKVWAIGPGMAYTHNPDNIFLMNLYFERHARNRPEGFSGLVRYVYHW